MLASIFTVLSAEQVSELATLLSLLSQMVGPVVGESESVRSVGESCGKVGSSDLL